MARKDNKVVINGVSMNRREPFSAHFQRYWQLYAMLLLPVIYFVIFKYVPMAGVQMAFRDYSVFKGMWDSPWVGLEHFKTFFSSSEFGKLLTNTLTLRGCLTARLLPRLLLSLPPVKTCCSFPLGRGAVQQRHKLPQDLWRRR